MQKNSEKNKNNLPKLNISVKEDFFNPFDQEDVKKKKEPASMKDRGGILAERKPAFNANRIEYTKKGSNYIVRARTHFGFNETVEIAPVILIGSEATAVDNLNDIVYELDKKKGQYALVLGYGSLYSHSDKPNLSYAYNKKTKQMHYITTRVVKYGEDLTINYGKDYWVAKKEFNMMDPGDESKAAVTTLEPKPVPKEIEESGAQTNAADIDQKKRTASFMDRKANPAVTGVAILGAGQS